jgi:hypothetical protein
MNILLNQSLQIKVNTNLDVTGASLRRIDYKDPAGTIGSFTTGITVENSNVLVYDIAKDVLNLPGAWKFHSYIESGADAWTGDVAKVIVTKLFT